MHKIVMKKELSKKIDYSISLLRKGERLALSLNPDEGYYLAFSGGKDSQVLYHLAIMSGVRFRAYYNITSIDPPENVYFIRENYPDVVFVHPKKNFFRLIEEKGLPTIRTRYCCERLKEGYGAGSVVLTGVRAAESRKRASMAEIEIFSRRKEHEGKLRARTVEQLEENEHRCIKGKDKVMMRPIFNWTDEDVWAFLHLYGFPINPGYVKAGRVGCMFCPFASREQIEMYAAEYPNFERQILRSLRKFWEKSTKHYIGSPEEYYDWWKSKKSMSDYIKMHG